MEIYLTRIHYRRLGVSNYDYKLDDPMNPDRGNYQLRLTNDPTSSTRFYTTAVWDMVDTFNQRSFGANRPVDNVSGFSMSNIQAALKDAKNWNEFRDNNISISGRRTEVTELFANWN